MPPLNALRAFEAAARRLSFARAGAELHVTPAAVSQQVRQLEEWLGLELFLRLPNGVALTEAGERYAADLTTLLDRLESVTQRLSENAGRRILTVATLPSFSSRWLIPRLGRLRAQTPGWEIQVSASNHLVDFVRDRTDFAIRFGAGVYPGLHVEPLMADWCFPVCSPALLESGPPLRTPNDLARHVLLHDQTGGGSVEETDWGHWLASVGARGVDASSGPRFTYTHMTMQAAIAGQGVALATMALIGDDLLSGRLVRPLPQAIPSPGRYFLVCPADAMARPELRAAFAWAHEEAARTMDQAVRLLGLPRPSEPPLV